MENKDNTYRRCFNEQEDIELHLNGRTDQAVDPACSLCE